MLIISYYSTLQCIGHWISDEGWLLERGRERRSTMWVHKLINVTMSIKGRHWLVSRIYQQLIPTIDWNSLRNSYSVTKNDGCLIRLIIPVYVTPISHIITLLSHNQQECTIQIISIFFCMYCCCKANHTRNGPSYDVRTSPKMEV